MTQSPERITLSSTALEAELIPEWGGRVVRLHSRQDPVDILYPVHADTFSPLYWPKGGMYPLMPYSNRIRGAQLRFQGRTYPLPAHPEATPHTLHGVAHTVPWQLLNRTADSVTLALHYEGPHWPWRFSAEQHIALTENRLHHRLSLTNQSDVAMPAGVGSHPYLCFAPGDTVRFDAGQSWAIDSFQIADGRRSPVAGTLSIQRPPPEGPDFAGYFSEWHGRLSLERAAGTVHVSSPDMAHLVLFAPSSQRYLCVEPVSHVADGFNLAAAGVPETGTETLAPGATLQRSVVIEWTPH
jgi:aldose 1-epimerase